MDGNFPLICPNCGEDEHIYTDEEFGFHKCEDCSTVWATDENDPDYDELDDDFLKDYDAVLLPPPDEPD